METTSHEPRAACVRNRARKHENSRALDAQGGTILTFLFFPLPFSFFFPSSSPSSFSPFLSFLFIDVSSGRIHLLIRTSCTKKNCLGFAVHALLLRQENYRDRDIETFIGTQQPKTKRACRKMMEKGLARWMEREAAIL